MTLQLLLLPDLDLLPVGLLLAFATASHPLPSFHLFSSLACLLFFPLPLLFCGRLSSVWGISLFPSLVMWEDAEIFRSATGCLLWPRSHLFLVPLPLSLCWFSLNCFVRVLWLHSFPYWSLLAYAFSPCFSASLWMNKSTEIHSRVPSSFHSFLFFLHAHAFLRSRLFWVTAGRKR